MRASRTIRHNKGRLLTRIAVRRRAGSKTQGWLTGGGMMLPVAIGRGGIRANKREGDGGTPRGTFRPVRLWFRGDRHARPRSGLPVKPIGPLDGWCEDPADRHYNQRIDVPPDSKGDRLRRTDALYDYIVELDHNTRPRIAGRGSAVFIHIARDGFAPTAGCVALRPDALRRLVEKLGPRTRIDIQ